MKRVYDFDNLTIEQIRQSFTAMDQTMELPPGAAVEKVTISDYLTAEWIRAANVPREKERAILFFHGGGFVFSNCNSFRNSAALLSEAAGCSSFIIGLPCGAGTQVSRSER